MWLIFFQISTSVKQILVRMVGRVITPSDRLSAHAQLGTTETRVKMASSLWIGLVRKSLKNNIFFLKSNNVINLLSDINECVANPCQNNGTCYNTMGSFTCTCAAGYDGDTCQNGKLRLGYVRVLKKVQHYSFCNLNKFGTLDEHNAMHVDWTLCRIMSSLIMGFGLVSIDGYELYCVRQGCRSATTTKSCTFVFCFPPVGILISTRFQRVMSEIKENKFSINCIIYYFRVEVIPWELWSI